MGTAFHVVSFDPGDAKPRYEAHSDGYRYFSLVDHTVGSVHIGKGVGILEPGGHIARHLHSYEEAFYILEGSVVVGMGDRKHLLVAGDYGFFPVEMAHAWRNVGDTPARWLEVAAGQPLPADDPRRDSFFTRAQFDLDGAQPIDLRDSRNRYVGHWEGVEHLAAWVDMGSDVGLDTGCIHPAPGIHIKKLVDRTLGAYLVQMIMCEFAPSTGPGGATHDHTAYEESFFLLEGEVEGTINTETLALRPGDAFWVGVGTQHGWRNVGSTTVRWLEAQCPQPPERYSYRHTERWKYLGEQIDQGVEAGE
jgi:quercetin dioxygenase-like cupin family protein